ncbi:MAG: lamin tail domain-containing protein [bacterium]
MKRVVIILAILLLLVKESTASLSDFLNPGSATQISGTVTSIIDGDTIKVEMSGTETTVRLLSIDTPELMDEPFAQTAKDFTSQTLSSQPIQLFYSKNPTQQWDGYGRLLAVVVKDDEIFNLKLLEQGLAVRMFIFNDIIKFPAWEDVEIWARQQGLNIWSNINQKGIFINEINPNPAGVDKDAEFVELYNNTATAVDVGNWAFISIYNEFIIPDGTTIPANGYLIIARTDTASFKQIYTTTPLSTIIINAGDNLILRNSYIPEEDLLIHLKADDKSYQDSLTYNLEWDNGAANDTGRTLERKSLSLTNVGDSEVGGVDDLNWDASLNLKGSPGESNIRDELDVASWIITCQRTTGAICTDDSQTKIIPYKANIAAMGLLEKGGYEGIVKKWIEWFFAHLEWGTIYDYLVQSGTETSSYPAEAEDRNLGTFFSLLKKYYQATFDVDFLKNYQSQLNEMGIWLLFVLQDYSDSLIWTNNVCERKLLINNAESYRGLKDLASIYFDLDFDDNLSQRDLFDSGAESIKQAINTELWNADSYYWEKDNLGNKTACNWATVYPDAVSQLHTILNVNLPEDYISELLYQTFNHSPPDTDFYAEVGYVASLMADTTNAELYQDSIMANVINQYYPSPWDVEDAGFYLLAENRLAEVEEIQPLINQPQELCQNFINSRMLTPWGGIQAQFMNTAQPSQTDGVNHEVPSEATSQALLYAGATNDKAFFDEQFEILIDNHLSPKDVLVWKLKPNGEWWKNNGGSYANAAIDDLRAIRGLLLAYDNFGDENYLDYARLLASGLKSHNIEENELRDYFAWNNGLENISQDVVLSYIDLVTIKRLAEFDTDWETILQTNKNIMLGGTTTSGLFYHKYNSISNQYYGMENSLINMIHSAWTAENLARYWQMTADQECRTASTKFLDFAKNEYNTYGKIYGQYDINTGIHSVEYEDVAVYSIIARLAFILGDFEFARTLKKNKILSNQNKEIKSQTVGCFGFNWTNPYAFVCLEALLALFELEAKEEYLIRGKVIGFSDKTPIEGVLMTLSGTTFDIWTTDADGYYEFKGTPGGTYTITPSKTEYVFYPKTIKPLNTHYDNFDFEGYCGKITSVSPVAGTIGIPITITGEGFTEEEIRISFGGVITVMMIKSSPLGTFTAIFTAPAQPSATITITAYGSISTMVGINYFFLKALHHFTIGTITSQIAGKGFEIFIRSLDARNEIFEYSGTATLTDDSMTIFPSETTPFSAGSWSSNVLITKVGTTTIKVLAENKTGISNSFFVSPSPINKLVFLTSTQTITAGTSTAFILFQTQDEFGNPSPTQSDVQIQLLSSSLKGQFSLTSSPWLPTNTITLTSGTDTGGFYYLDTLVGTHTIIVKDGIWVAGTQSVIVNPAVIDHFTFQTITTQTAGQEFQIQIQAVDVFENLVNFNGTVSLTETFPGIATFTAGISQASVTITKAGTTSIFALFESKSGTSNPFWVNPAEFSQLTIGTITSQIAGQPFTIKITALDVYGNIATYSQTADLKAETTSQITFTQGIYEGTLTITKAGTTTVYCSGFINYFISGTSNQFFVRPAVLDHFAFGTISSQQAGIEFEIEITAFDAYKNIATYTGIAYLNILPYQTNPFTNGFWKGTVTTTKSGTTTIIAFIDNKQGTSNDFWVSPADLDHFSFATITDQIAGQGFGITIIARDIYENIANYNDKVKLQDISNTLIGTLTDNFKQGLWQGTVSITRAGTTCIFATSNGKSGTSNTFSVTPDALNKIVISPPEKVLEIEGECQFNASGFDKYENEILGLDYTWQTIIGSVNPPVGRWTLFKAGIIPTTGTLTASYELISGYATITLETGTLSYIIITASITTMIVGESKIFFATGYDKYENEQVIEGGFWEIENGIGNISPSMGTWTKFTAGLKAGCGRLKYQLNQVLAFATITILPGTHTCFQIGTISSPQIAGVPFAATITAQDAYGNIIDYTGSVILTISSGKISPDAVNLSYGIWTGTITLLNSAENVFLTVQDTVKGTSNLFNVQANVFDHFKISEIGPSQLINSQIPIVITAEDVYENINTDFNGIFSLTDDTGTIEPEGGSCISGKWTGSVTISKAKPNIRITVISSNKTGISNLFTTLIDNDSNITLVEENTSIEIPRGVLPTDFYIVIDKEPEEETMEINVANSRLSHNPTVKGIADSLRLFQPYNKDNEPIEVGTDSFILISLPYLDENQDEFVDVADAKIPEMSLKIYKLETTSPHRWIEVEGSTVVHPYKNIVSAYVPRFGIYMLLGQITPENLNLIVVYPNPFKPIRGDREIIFDGLPANTYIRIYDISGSLIKEIHDASTSYPWDVKDGYGRDVPSGIYIYLITNDKGMKKTGKIAIIR